MSVGLKDIAERLGLSEATVSLALNGNKIVKAETRIRVQKMADEMGYIPNSLARSLVRKKSGMLGLIIPDIENVYYSELVKHINRYCQKVGYRLFVSISNNDVHKEKENVLAMIENCAEGVVIAPVNVSNFNPDYLRYFQTNSIPFVFSSSRYEDVSAPYVMCDLETGMYSLTRYLLTEKGYRNFLLLTGPENVLTLRLRENGFLRALKNEKDVSNEIVRVQAVDYDTASETIQQYLQQKKKIDVIMCVNDTMAIGVINTLMRQGIKVPEDVAVTGFDDSLFAQISVVTLTTVVQDVKKIAERSVDLLMDRISNQTSANTEILIPTHIVKRASTEGK